LDASDHASAACYRRAENVDIVAIVVAELKLRHVQGQVMAPTMACFPAVPGPPPPFEPRLFQCLLADLPPM